MPVTVSVTGQVSLRIRAAIEKTLYLSIPQAAPGPEIQFYMAYAVNILCYISSLPCLLNTANHIYPRQLMSLSRLKTARAHGESDGYLALEPSAGEIIDIGVNLAHKSFQSSLPAIISRAYACNVTKMIITGTTLQSSRTALDLAHHYKEPCQLFSTAGTHPHYAKDCRADWFVNTRSLLDDPLCVAVGETGLDFNRNFSPPDVQEAIFDAHLSLAADCGKPLFCHERDAHKRFLDVLNRHPEIEGSRLIIS